MRRQHQLHSGLQAVKGPSGQAEGGRLLAAGGGLVEPAGQGLPVGVCLALLQEVLNAAFDRAAHLIRQQSDATPHP